MKRFRIKLAAVVTVAVAALGGGAALAADKLTPAQESDAIVADAAKELGVSSAKLEAALVAAMQSRVDAAVADGRLTAAQAAELKERIASGDFPLVGVGPGGRGHHGHGGPVSLDAAADFLGLTEAELRTKLEVGDTLAEIAAAEGKTKAGLVAALVTAAKERLETAVAEGRITAAQRTELLSGLQARVEDAVEGELGFRGPHPGGPHPDSPMGMPPAESSGDDA